MIETVTVWTPQPSHPKWRDDYVDLMRAQRHSALRFGHAHTVMSASPVDGFDTVVTDLGDDLMRAMILGVVRRLERPVDKHLVFLDVDCLVNRPLGIVFRKRVPFDIALTTRKSEVSPIINGVMYVRKDGVANALMFYREALRLCKPHWGGDQEAISEAAAPVHPQGTCKRNGCEIAFLSAKHYAPTPKEPGVFHEGAPVVHFKGATKNWMLDYAREFQLWGG